MDTNLTNFQKSKNVNVLVLTFCNFYKKHFFYSESVASGVVLASGVVS